MPREGYKIGTVKFHLLLTILLTSALAVSAIKVPSIVEEIRNPFKKPASLEQEEIKARIEQLKETKEDKSEIKELITSGKGTWVNLWNYPTDVDKFTKRLKKYHIDTIYLQVNRSTTDVFKNKEAFDAILKKAHEEDIKVIGWSYCFLKDIDSDVRKLVKPALYTSPDGHKLDAMAADIEENISLWAVKTYTEKIKAQLPKDYPMIAITFSPKIKQQYPWKYIGENWDVIMPMVYWHGTKDRSEKGVYNFVKDSIADLRTLTGKEDLNIHLITDGDRTHHNEVKLSLEAAKDLGINAGVSIYPEHLASDEMLDSLKDFKCSACGV